MALNLILEKLTREKFPFLAGLIARDSWRAYLPHSMNAFNIFSYITEETWPPAAHLIPAGRKGIFREMYSEIVYVTEAHGAQAVTVTISEPCPPQGPTLPRDLHQQGTGLEGGDSFCVFSPLKDLPHRFIRVFSVYVQMHSASLANAP